MTPPTAEAAGFSGRLRVLKGKPCPQDVDRRVHHPNLPATYDIQREGARFHLRPERRSTHRANLMAREEALSVASFGSGVRLSSASFAVDFERDQTEELVRLLCRCAGLPEPWKG